MEEKVSGLHACDVRKLAFQLAVNKSSPAPFHIRERKNWKQIAKKFLKRHQNLSVQKSVDVSLAGAKRFTKQNANALLEILLQELWKIHFDPTIIFNFDETTDTSAT
jgi:hypothetical protein